MSRGTPDPHCHFRISPTGISPSLSSLSSKLRLYSYVRYVSPLPLYISLYIGLGSYPFARHYSGNHLFIFFSSGYLDVSVPRVPSITLFIHVTVHTLQCVGSPIRISTDLCSFAAPRSFSQLVTSFFGA